MMGIEGEIVIVRIEEKMMVKGGEMVMKEEMIDEEIEMVIEIKIVGNWIGELEGVIIGKEVMRERILKYLILEMMKVVEEMKEGRIERVSGGVGMMRRGIEVGMLERRGKEVIWEMMVGIMNVV